MIPRDSIPDGTRVLVLTGTCGSGKSTVAALIGARPGWARVSEDEIWARQFGKARGAFGTDEHRDKRRIVHEEVFAFVLREAATRRCVVIDATVHESPPEAFAEYREFFEREGIALAIRVLHPTLAVAVARDAARVGRLGAERVASLRAKFTGMEFPAEWFLDTSEETAEETARRVVGAAAVEE